MDIALHQIVIVLLVLAATLVAGKAGQWLALVLAALWTLGEAFADQTMILQFATIMVAFALAQGVRSRRRFRTWQTYGRSLVALGTVAALAWQIHRVSDLPRWVKGMFGQELPVALRALKLPSLSGLIDAVPVATTSPPTAVSADTDLPPRTQEPGAEPPGPVDVALARMEAGIAPPPAAAAPPAPSWLGRMLGTSSDSAGDGTAPTRAPDAAALQAVHAPPPPAQAVTVVWECTSAKGTRKLDHGPCRPGEHTQVSAVSR